MPPPLPAPPTAATSENSSVQEKEPDNTKMENSGSDLAAITVSSRIAPFWRDMAKLWFTQFESIMAPQKLGSEAKFDLVVSKLGKEELSTVADLLEDAANKEYTALRNRLIMVFQESADLQFDRLVKEMDLGDQKPSQLYRRMAEAARNANVADSTLKRLWLQRLPAGVRAILSVSEDAKLDNIVAMADKILESMGQGVVAEIATPTTSSTVSTGPNADLIFEFRNMALEIRHLKNEVSELRSRPLGRSDSKGQRSRSRSQFRARNKNPNWVCRYHYKFKENARKCFQPCSWGQQQQQQQQRWSAGGAPPTAPATHAWQTPSGN